MPTLPKPRHLKYSAALLSCLTIASAAHAGLDVRAILAKAKADVAAKKNAPAAEAAPAGNTMNNPANPTNPATDARWPASGTYDASNSLFERTLVIKADGQFSLEILQRGQGGHSASGAGKLEPGAQGWQFSQGNCHMQLSPGKDDLMMRVDGCTSLWGDVMFNGRYQHDKAQAGKAGSLAATTHKIPEPATPATPTAPATPNAVATAGKINPRLQAQFNCQNMNMSDDALPTWLAQMVGLKPNQVWEQEIKVASGYTFQGLPIMAAMLSEADGGSFVMLLGGDQAAIKAAIKKSKTPRNTSTAWIRQIGNQGFVGFAGNVAGQTYVQCSFNKPFFD